MASAVRDWRYHDDYVVDGSLARDLDWAVRERELQHAGETPRHQETVRETPRVQTQTKTHVQVRERQRVSWFSVLGVSAIIGMAIMVLMSYIQLTVLSASTVELKKDLAVLETENVRLTAQYEQMFDMTSVKEAAEAVGMVKPGSSQVCYLDLSGGDTAVVYRHEEPNTLSRVMTSLNHGVYAVVEYFD